MRFAVVMYGGLSLAIYMNGVAREMLRLVRATAPAKEDKINGKSEARSDLKGSEVVYLQLGQMPRRGDRTLFPRENEGESVEWRALRLIGVVAGLVALLAVLVGSALPPVRAFYRKVRALFLRVKASSRIVLAYAEKRLGEMDKAARQRDGK